MFPVIEAGALHLALIEREAEWLDEVQRRAGSEARASRVAGVPMNFGVNEHNVRRHVVIAYST